MGICSTGTWMGTMKRMSARLQCFFQPPPQKAGFEGNLSNLLLWNSLNQGLYIYFLVLREGVYKLNWLCVATEELVWGVLEYITP